MLSVIHKGPDNVIFSFSDSTVLNYQEVKIKLFGMIGTPPGDKWF